jgi:hypothetical protein
MRAIFLLAAAALTAGCAPTSFEGGDAFDAGPAEAPAAFRVDGVVAVERVRTADGAQTSVGAKFMRHAGLPEAAERLVGSRLLLPESGECTSVADLEDVDVELTGGGAAAAALENEVELIDVGDVALATDLTLESAIGPSARQPFVVHLTPRAFPDVGELVSGVFYTSPDLAAPLPAPGRYAIEGTGAAAAAPFVLEADAPAEPGDVLLDGVSLSRGAEAVRGADVLVTWSSATSEARSSDRVYVDVQAADGEVHRCAFEDTGSAVLPGGLIAAPSVAVAVHRLRETTMALPSEIGDEGEPGRVVVRFDLAVVGRVAVTRIESSAPAEPFGG